MMTKMLRWSNDDNKKLMRQNILKHRQTLFQHLECINDTVLKPKIKLNSHNSKNLNLNIKEEPLEEPKTKVKVKRESNLITSKQFPRLEEVKEESVDLYSEFSDDFLSANSNEEWCSSNSASEETDAVSRRRSSRLELVKQNINKKWKNKNKNDYVHDVDNIIINELKDVRIKANQSSPESSYVTQVQPSKIEGQVDGSLTRFRAPIDRDIHNAKERECRERIRKMFMDLQKYCSQLNNTRRVPSKYSILVAAKKECDLQKNKESHLLMEKAMWLQKHKILREKLNNLRYSIVNS